jgi:hypothetical protein
MKLLSPRAAQIAVALGAVILVWVRAQQNLALHKAVRISSVLLGDAAGVVNGFVEWGSYAVHTRVNAPAWLVIDLERASPIGEVRVFGRGDGYHTGAGTPIAVELSDDGLKFARAAVCPEVVTQVSPCRATLHGAAARYVRLAHPTHLVLSEVEVFAPR